MGSWNVTTFQHMEGATCAQHRFCAFDIEIHETFYICMWCKCISHICVCTKYVNVP